MSILRRLMGKPWQTQGDIDDPEGDILLTIPPAKIGLWMFLAVATSVFFLFTVSYTFRMDLSDWVPVPKPNVLWLNTGLLIVASIALERARVSARDARIGSMRLALIIGGLCSLAFIGGQLIAWRELTGAGYLLAENPASSFFYLITALHGIHVLGGLWVWAKTSVNLLRGIDVRLSVELCAVYWHYLLIVWIVLFAMLLST
jgi:cytochrome c oxidase subunit 3